MMSISNELLVITIVLALLFDLVNGFHDAANSIATVVSTRVLSPAVAVIWAAVFNFIAILIFVPRVADTISKIVKVEPHDIGYVYVILTGLLAAIIWGLLTWFFGLPTSSSHAIIGGISGAALVYGGVDVLRWDMLQEIVFFIVLAPLFGCLLGMVSMIILYWVCRYKRPASVKRVFDRGQLLSAALYSIGHGANDAQKTMGIIVALLVAAGRLDPHVNLSLSNDEVRWIILSCQLAMALGTACGGWRIVKTMGMKIVKLKSSGGFCAEISGASTLFLATHFGIPVSTTHTITGAIIGVGSISSHLSRIKWGVAANVIWAWFLTIPVVALLAATLFQVMTFFR